MAAALLQEAQNRGLSPERPDHTDISIGRGVRAKMANETIIVGNAEFLESNRIGVNYFKRRAAQCRISGETVLYVARNGRLQGMIVLENAPRPGLFDLLKNLRFRGIKRLDVISGDAAPGGFLTGGCERFLIIIAGIFCPKKKPVLWKNLKNRVIMS